MLPTRDEAERLLNEAESMNPGPWGDHSRVVARCAERIAAACGDMDPDKAYVLGLLHDYGRKHGPSYLKHVWDGWQDLLALGWDEAARACLTHSFNTGAVEEYIGKVDVTPEQARQIREALANLEMDDYDRLIQLCDSVAAAEGPVDIEARMGDVKRRYGMYPQSKWDRNLALKARFEERMGKDLYDVVGRTPLTLRPMTAFDYDRVYDLWMSCKNMGFNDLDDSREGIEKYLKRNPNTCFVATEAGALAGVILSGHDGRRGFIHHMAVAEGFRGRGIGRALAERALEALKAEGIHKVALLVFKYNAAGNAFWEKLGFTVRDDLNYRNRALAEMKRIDT